MGDSEIVVAQTSVITGNTPAATYSSAGYSDACLNAAPDDGSSAVGATGDLDASVAVTDVANKVPDGSDLGCGNEYDTNLNSARHEGPSITTYDSKTSYGVADANESVAGLENMSADASKVAGYDSSVYANNASEANDIVAVGTDQNGGNSEDLYGPISVHQLVDGSALSAEEDRLWSIVRANSLDFDAWTALIEETEKIVEDNILKIRKVYDAFLAEFPLCYGYWKKYADHEAHLGSTDKVVEVYERAVQGVTYSVDMWLHYCAFAIITYGDAETIRRLFERGLAYVGTDYLSFSLWDKYIEYECTQQEWSHLAMIYTRILESPNQQLDRFFNDFKELVASRPLSELRTAEDAAAAAGATLDAAAQETEGEVHPNAVEYSTKPVSAALREADELEKYIAVREELYMKAKESDSKIIGFETAIRRPYFHVRPLNMGELENWHNYLNFIEGGGNFNKIVKLYERCLIACANYPDYWIRYVLCMEASGSMDLANNALARATQVFVKRKPEIQLFAARFKEQCGDIPGARAAYQLVHTEISPGFLEAIIKHANMEHRLGHVEDACSVYEHAIAIEKGKEHSRTSPLLSAQYSRFLHLVCGNLEKAREVLVQALENVQLSKPLLEAFIYSESIQPLLKRIDYLESFVDKFLVPNPDNPNTASTAEREELSSIFLEFLDLFGDAQSIKKAYDRHAKLFLHHGSTSESKKRQAEDFLVSDRTKLAKSYSSAPSPASSVMGAYPSAQNQWVVGYGVQPQAGPQVMQSQGQQWNLGYNQQAAYGAYGSSYSHAQIPSSLPQNAAYATYPPPTYQAQQGFSQQSYAQSAALTPAQQPTPVPHVYYGGYP